MTRRYVTARAVNQLAEQLTERDWQVIKYVSSLRFVTGSQLARLCFPSKPAANSRSARRALLRLTRLGVLARLPRSIGGVRSGSAGFVYHCDVAGQRLAALRGWRAEPRRWRSLTPGQLFLAHTLQVAELHTRLIEGERSGRYELTELTAEPQCHRTYNGLGSQRVLRPDSLVRLGQGPYLDSFWVEVDQSTEGSRAVGWQLTRYIAYYQSGAEQSERGVFPLTLWLTNTPERTAVIEDCVARLPSDAQALFQVAEFDQALPIMTGLKQ